MLRSCAVISSIHFRYKFHARPVNEKIFENSCMGVKKVAPKVCTVPHGFDLETERRNDTWKNKSSEKEESYHFHANPVPKSILEGTVVSMTVFLNHFILIFVDPRPGMGLLLGFVICMVKSL